MKLRVMVLEQDRFYIKHLTEAAGDQYFEQLELYFFSDAEKAYDTLKNVKIDIVLVDEDAKIDEFRVPKSCIMAYLTENSDVSFLNGKPAVQKYQRLSSFNRQMIKLYADSSPNEVGFAGAGADKIICFASPMGGAGVTVLAAACAMEAAAAGKKVLHLDLSHFGDTSILFHGGASDSFSEIIYALRNQQSNLMLKIHSTAQQDPETGVFFFSPTQVALDNEEITTDDIVKLIDELQKSGDYQDIIIDMDFGLDQQAAALMNNSTAIVMVTNGSELGNAKLKRAVEALKIKDQDGSLRVLDRMFLMVNGRKGNLQSLAGELGLKSLCEIPRYQNATADQAVKQILLQRCFKTII